MLNYPVELSDDEGTVLATFPDVPGAITYGETRAEALEHAPDAAERMLARAEIGDGHGTGLRVGDDVGDGLGGVGEVDGRVGQAREEAAVVHEAEVHVAVHEHRHTIALIEAECPEAQRDFFALGDEPFVGQWQKPLPLVPLVERQRIRVLARRLVYDFDEVPPQRGRTRTRRRGMNLVDRAHA